MSAITGRCQVLIADDSKRARSGLRALLALHREIELVGEAVDGRDAVRMVGRCRPDVVLMDARMPQMNGLEAARQIKERWPEVRVIVVSMYASYRAAALAAGAEGFLVKGCAVEELVSTVLGTWV